MPYQQDDQALQARDEREERLSVMKAALSRPVAVTVADVVCKSVAGVLRSPGALFLAAVAKIEAGDVVPFRRATPSPPRVPPPAGPAGPAKKAPLPLAASLMQKVATSATQKHIRRNS